MSDARAKAARENGKLGGRPKVIRYCQKCRAKCKSAAEALVHCRKPRKVVSQ